MNNRYCEDCAHFSPLDEFKGECRFNAPILMTELLTQELVRESGVDNAICEITKWPVVCSTLRCGKFTKSS